MWNGVRQPSQRTRSPTCVHSTQPMYTSSSGGASAEAPSAGVCTRIAHAPPSPPWPACMSPEFTRRSSSSFTIGDSREPSVRSVSIAARSTGSSSL